MSTKPGPHEVAVSMLDVVTGTGTGLAAGALLT
jgi:hypothetical protein